MKRGKLIVICGIDGAGKTTLQNKLAHYLEMQGKKVLITRQPTTAYRENPDIRHYLETGTTNLSINTIAMMAATDRMQHIEKTIIPSLNNGEDVICDRYVYSTFAYFQARSADMTFVKMLNQFVPTPDAGIFLKISSEIAMKRVLSRDGQNRKFEEKNIAYLNTIQNNLEDSIPKTFAMIDANTSIEEVFKISLQYLKDLNFFKSAVSI